MSKNQTVSEPTLSGVALTVQCEITRGVTIAFQDELGRPRTRAEIDMGLDLIMDVVGRQKAKIDLSEKLMALAIAREEIKKQGDERVRLAASYRAAHDVSGRRSAFKLNEPQQRALDQCDSVIQAMVKDIPRIEGSIRRLRALIAGEDVPEEAVAFAEAAE